MKELIDLRGIWDRIVNRWKQSLGWVIAVVLSFGLGSAWQLKQTTDDCKIIGSFRDSTQAYTCQVRVR